MLAATHTFHARAGNAEIAAILKREVDSRPGAASAIVTLPAATLQSFAGTYRQDSNAYFPDVTAGTVVVEVKEGLLSVTSLSSRPITLYATSELTFIAPEMPSADFKFERSGNVVERINVLRPVRAREDTTSPYVRVSNSTEAVSESRRGSSEDLATEPKEAPRSWPAFRGAGASGIADGQGAVGVWDVGTGRNVRWKTPIPGIANASPIVWGDRVFIAAAISPTDTTFRVGDYGDSAAVKDRSEHLFKLFALDAKTGSVVWEREAYKGIPRTSRHPKGSHASSTPVTDGNRVVVLFGTIGLLLTYDMNGRLMWTKDLGLLDSGHFYDPTVQWGHSSSPIIYQDSVILQIDRQKDSYIAAYDLATGVERWQTRREGEIPTWGTPTIAKGRSGDELITNGTKVRGYDPETGRQRWILSPNSEVTVATPVVGPDMVYVTGGYAPVRPIYAIRPGGSGDISQSSDAIAWRSEREGTYIPTPIVYRGLLYMLNNNGILTAYDAQTGARVYRARVGMGGSFAASPVAADGRLYMASEDGDVYVIKAGREYVELARHAMNEVIMATPAISDGLIVIRTLHHVYGIGQPD